MTEVVVVPRRVRGSLERASIRGHRSAVVSEERLAETHPRVHDVVVGIDREHVTKMERCAPRMCFEAHLREVTMCEERCVGSGLGEIDDLHEQSLELSATRGPLDGALCALSKSGET